MPIYGQVPDRLQGARTGQTATISECRYRWLRLPKPAATYCPGGLALCRLGIDHQAHKPHLGKDHLKMRSDRVPLGRLRGPPGRERFAYVNEGVGMSESAQAAVKSADRVLDLLELL